MAPKRSAEAATSSSSKKPKRDEDAEKPSGRPTIPPTFTSSLLTDEVDFPRGGGTSLTPFETKQSIQEGRREADLEVKKDRLLSSSNNNKKTTGAPTSRKAQAARKEQGEKLKSIRAERDKDTIRVEHLNYKRLQPGTRVLARVHSVLQLHLIVSLPNQLLAHVPITQISPQITEKLTRGERDSDDDDDEDEESDDEDEDNTVDLSTLFAPGQYVTAVVTQSFNPPTTLNDSFTKIYPPTETTRLASRLELSLQPHRVNEEVAIADVTKGYKLTVAIAAEEDHGYTVEMGVPKAVGFLPKQAIKDVQYTIGQLVDVVVSDVKGRIIHLSPVDAARAMLSEVTSVGSVLPGHLVSALVTAVVPSGLNVKLCGFFDGTIDLAHCGENVEQQFKVGKKVKARVIYENLGVSPKRFGLSVLPHVVALESPKGPNGPLESSLPIGTNLEAKVVRIEKDWGLVCSTPDGNPAFAHISHVADERPPALSPWKVDSSYPARVIGHSPFDGCVLLSLAPKVLAQRFMLVSEVKVGEVIRGTVHRLTDKALFVNVSGSVDAVCWPLHYADIMLKHPEKRFRPGQSIKCRVFAIEPAKNRVKLTCKKTLVESELDVPSSIEEIQRDMVTPGVISKIFEKGCLVELFGGCVAYVPLAEASDTYVKDLHDVVTVGQPVSVRITSVDREAERLLASIRQAQPGYLAAAAIEVGDSATGKVVAVHQDQIALALQPSQSRALLSLGNLAHHRGIKIAELRDALQIGETIKDLEVAVKNPDTGLIIVGIRGSPTRQSVSSAVFDLSSLKVGEIIPAVVSQKDQRGYLLRISKGIHGILHPTDQADDFSLVSDSLPLKEAIKCCVIRVDPKKKHLDLSTRPSRIGSTSKTAIVDKEINDLADLKVGQRVRGFVKNMTGGGLFVSLGRNVTARVMIKEMFDDYVADWQSRFKVGQLVDGKVIAIDAGKKQVEMSLRKKKTAKKAAKLGLADFQVDQKVDAIVRKVETYGMFLRIDGTNISGLCHRSELSDDPKADVAVALNGYREGDKVKAKITTIDVENGKIAFGVKASYFGEEDFQKEDEDEDEDDDMSDVGEDVADGAEAAASDEDEEDDGSGAEDDFMEVPEESEDEEEEDQGDEGAEDDDSSDDEVAIASPTAKAASAPKRSKQALGGLAAGFDWTGAEKQQEEDEDMSDSDSDNGEVTIKPAASRPSSSSTADFERALVASPNSSYLWVQFMSFQLELNEIAKARAIGLRALNTIGIREQEEKLNVWMALLNLENAHGTPESLDKLFREAVQYNDALTVHLRMAKILALSEKYEAAEDIYARAAKKFGASLELWEDRAEFHFLRSEPGAARALLPRSLQSLDKADHPRMVERFALLEFRLGDAERGITIYEGLIERHPKRLPLWSTYIDQLAKRGDIKAVRALVDRALDIKWNAHRAKFLFKKLLAIEARIGDEDGQERAKAKAREWVMANQDQE